MNTELEDRLRADMQRFTRDIHVPRGLAQKAYRHGRRRRTTLRAALAAGAAAALAAGAVAVAGATGAFGSAPPAPTAPAETTAYILEHVESALAPANVDNLISVNRVVFPPGMTLEPVVGGGLRSGPATADGGSAWNVASLVHWAYRGTQRYSAYGPDGQRVFGTAVWVAQGAETEIAVIYANRTWWTATTPLAVARPSSCSATSIQLSDAAGNGWPAFIRSQLSCGAYTVAGHQVVDGIDAIKITGSMGQLTLLVNPATYLPVQLTIGPLQNSFQWLSPTPAHLAQLKEPVPASFRQVPPPTQP